MRLTICSLVWTAVVAATVPALAQEPAPQGSLSNASAAVAASLDGQVRYRTPPPRRPSTIGVKVFGLVDYEFLLASQSYAAVLGDSKVPLFGAGVDITGLWKGLFVRVDASHASKSGSRVVVDATNRVIPVNVPITIAWTPLDFDAGWRFTRKRSHVVPYVGGGGTAMSYKETSDFAEVGDNVATTFTGYNLFAGVDVPIYRHVTIGFEATFRSFPGSLGDSANSVSQSFGEKDAGGYSGRLIIGYSWHKR